MYRCRFQTVCFQALELTSWSGSRLPVKDGLCVDMFDSLALWARCGQFGCLFFFAVLFVLRGRGGTNLPASYSRVFVSEGLRSGAGAKPKACKVGTRSCEADIEAAMEELAAGSQSGAWSWMPWALDFALSRFRGLPSGSHPELRISMS